jgi:hypothetical protein
MKKLRNFLIVMLGVICLTGCSMKFEANMAVSNEGKLDFTIVSAYDKELIKNLMSMADTTDATDETTDTTATAEPTTEEMKAYLAGTAEDEATYTALGYTKADYENGEFLGFQFTASIPNIDTVSTTEDVTYDLSAATDGTTPLIQQKMFKKEGTIYTAAFTFNADSETDTSEDTTETTDYSQYLSQMVMDFKYIITLPQAPIESNATTVSEDGKTLTWNLASTGITTINFKFELPSTVATTGDSTSWFTLDDQMMMYIGIGLIVLILVIVIIIVSISKKKRKNLEPLEGPVNTVDSALNAVPSPVEPVITPAVEMPAAEVSKEIFETPSMPSTSVVEETPIMDSTPVVEMSSMPSTSVVEETPIMDSTPVVEMSSMPSTPVFEPLVMETQQPVQPTFGGFSNSAELTSAPLETQAPVQQPAPIFQETVIPAEPIQVVQPTFESVPVVETSTMEAPAMETPVVEPTPVFETPSLDSAPVFEIPTNNNR